MSHRSPTVSERSFEEYIRKSAVSREVIDIFLAGPSWAKFDAELGYVQRDYLRPDAIDRSSAIYSFSAHGARTPHVYADRKPRINTYGDSFTACEQVNDGETWQEYLAGHLGEPIGNYGVGSHGVYQAYRRMIREEQTGHGAQYLVLYIWGEDSSRSLLRCRYGVLYPWFQLSSQYGAGREFYAGGRGFHGNFWAHLEMDLDKGCWGERQNPLATPESLYRMTDPDWMVEQLIDDVAMQLMVYIQGHIPELNRSLVEKLASCLQFPFAWSRENLRDQSTALLNRYAQRATQYVLGKAQDFAARHGKQLLIVLFDPYFVLPQMRQNFPRDDQETLEYLQRQGMRYFDMNPVHLEDFKRFNLDWNDYMRLYLQGHYNPRGNHFFAYAIKDTIVEWLDPKPITYRNQGAQPLSFTGYLQGYAGEAQ